MKFQGVVLVVDSARELAAVFPEGRPWEGRCAPPLAANDGSEAIAQQLVATPEERHALEAAFSGRVFECTLGGLAVASLRFPQFQWLPAAAPLAADPDHPPAVPPSLGFVAGYQPTDL